MGISEEQHKADMITMLTETHVQQKEHEYTLATAMDPKVIAAATEMIKHNDAVVETWSKQVEIDEKTRIEVIDSLIKGKQELVDFYQRQIDALNQLKEVK